MITKLGIIWAIVEIMLGCQMIYCAFIPASNKYVITATLYWLWFSLYAWNPFNIFRTKNKEN